MYFWVLWLSYNPACNRPIPYPASEMDHIAVSPLCFHLVSNLSLAHMPSYWIKPYPASRQTYVGPSFFYSQLENGIVLNYWNPLAFLAILPTVCFEHWKSW